MKLGVMAAALVTERTPEAMQPEALFTAAHRLGLHSLELPGRGWAEDGFVARVGELQARYGIEAHVGFGDDYVAHGADPLAGRSARAGYEILVAVYESARRRARIDLPLQVTESPSEAMVTAGAVSQQV